tara:strand:+ start:14747 stop:15910 length:1164 start_codon:yes stop_codon:yes gene_type:complete
MNVSRSNKYNIRIDLDKSHDSYLHDKTSGKEILDFLGMFGSLPLGYNHPIFHTQRFKEEVLRVSHTKVTNCFIGSDESRDFDEAFTSYAPDCFKHFYYCCTGSLAVESAMKAVLEGNTKRNPKIVTFTRSFHGINGWASFVTSRQDPVGPRLGKNPKKFVLECEDNLPDFLQAVASNKVVAVLIEPIRSTHGDLYFKEGFLQEVCRVCKEKGILVIFDEVQTGMGVTGTNWYYEQLGVEPDVVVFGKKSQLSGIMANDKVSAIFTQKEKKLEATWDATLIDMVRCRYILQAYKDLNILSNVKARGDQLVKGLSNPYIKNLRSAGLLVGFDLDSGPQRDRFQQYCYDNGLLVNTGGKNSIRLRPHLAVSYNEVKEALEVLNNYGKPLN